jgi:hypothetical protein
VILTEFISFLQLNVKNLYNDKFRQSLSLRGNEVVVLIAKSRNSFEVS